MKLTKQQLKQIIKEELSEVINEIGVPFLSTGLKNPEMVNIVFKNNGEFYDGPFSVEDAKDIIATQDASGELKIEPASPQDPSRSTRLRTSAISDIEDAYDKRASPEDIIAMINRQKSK